MSDLRDMEGTAITVAVALGQKPEGAAFNRRVDQILETPELLAAYAAGYTDRARVQGRIDSGRADEFASECREAADAWEYGNAELEERADYAEEWRDEIENAQAEIDGADEDDLDDEVETLADTLEQAGEACQL